MFKGYFISGNDTNVGKTIVSSILVNKLEAQYFKPIQCGKNEFSETDSDVVKKFCPNAEIIPETYFFKDPVSPNIASKKEKRKDLLIYDAINKILIKNNFIAPKLINQNYHQNFIEVNDLGKTTVLDQIKKSKNKFVVFKKIIDLLIKLQKIRTRRVKNFQN